MYSKNKNESKSTRYIEQHIQQNEQRRPHNLEKNKMMNRQLVCSKKALEKTRQEDKKFKRKQLGKDEKGSTEVGYIYIYIYIYIYMGQGK